MLLPRFLLATACLVLLAACGPVVEVEPLGPVRLEPPELTSRVVAADGTLLAELHAEQDRRLVPLARIPQALRDAVVAVEDQRFYRHDGVDARAIVRALFVNARAGEVRQGGSTITQQLAKNAVVGDARNARRKIAEAAVALRLERQLSKDEILERYLNTVYFGNGAYGVATAARRYFDRRVEELTLPQAALLAGLLRAPARYDPYAHPVRARERRDLVLRLMASQGMVSAADAARARDEGLGVVAPRDRDWRAPWFVDHVLALLQHDPRFAALGAEPAERAALLFRGGVRVETTLDPSWQEAAEDAVAATVGRPGDPAAAVVALEPASGAVRALVGGGDPDTDGSRFNLATDGRRQPGSTFKSIVLAAALEQGHTLDEVFPGGRRVVLPPRPGEPTSYAVRNYDDLDLGEISLREATAWSVNVVFARLVSQLGPDAVVEMARRLGVTSRLPAVRSLALGTGEVSPLEMAAVQATLASGGVRRRPFAVERVVAADGTVLYEHRGRGERVLEPAVAYLVTDALRGVVEDGTGQRAGLQRPTAGKTGTTQHGADAWFAGYTPDMAAAVWVGYPEGAVPMEPPRTPLRVEGGNWPAEIFARFGLRALAEVPAAEFPRPSLELVSVEVDGSRNCLPNPYTPPRLIVTREYLAGTAPTTVCREPTGPAATAVPQLVGVPLDVAVRLLDEAGLRARRAAVESQTLPPGYVVRQEPEPGTALATGERVDIWVSTSERATARVPDVLGLDVTEARIHLEAGGFAVRVRRSCPDVGCGDEGAAIVWSQLPGPDDVVPAHSVVRIVATPG